MWDSLITHVPLDTPALVGGDFNCVMDPSKRVGGRRPLEKEYTEFSDTCGFLGLQDSASTGCHFTWTDTTKYSKIDRVLINNSWLDENLFCRTNFLTRGVHSDHSASLITLFAETVKFKGSFKFSNTWLNHPNFQTTLQNTWSSETVPYGKQGHIFFKLIHFQSALRTLNLKAYSYLVERAEAARVVLQQAQEKCDENPLDPDLKMEEIGGA